MPNSTNIIARSIYKHPALSLDEFNLSFIEPFLLKVSKENKQLFLLGDFNINLLNMSTDPKVSSFLSNLGSHLILPNILLPTRITDNSMTLIDNIFLLFLVLKASPVIYYTQFLIISLNFIYYVNPWI